MTLHAPASPHAQCRKKQQEEYRSALQREIRDFLRTGDDVILKRILFKTFVHHSVPWRLKSQKAGVIMMLMMRDQDISSTLTWQRGPADPDPVPPA